MPGLNLPEWMTAFEMPEWFEPKLLVFFVLVGGVLFLSRRSRRDKAERRMAAMLKHGEQ